MNLQEQLSSIAEELKTGQVAPQRLAELKDQLAGESSTLMDRQLELQLAYASFHNLHKDELKSDKAVKMSWLVTPDGTEEAELETRQKQIKVLREAISSHLRVADNQARNLY